MPNKPFITYEEQINHLVHHKKLEIHDKQYAIAYLKKTSYFALINGYKKLFKDNTTKLYKTGVCFEDIVCLYCFDEALRALLMKNILIIERKIKSLLSYYFSEKFGNEQ